MRTRTVTRVASAESPAPGISRATSWSIRRPLLSWVAPSGRRIALIGGLCSPPDARRGGMTHSPACHLHPQPDIAQGGRLVV